MAVIASPVLVFWLIGNRLDTVCREDVPEHCGMWKAPQQWDPATARVLGVVAAGVMLACGGLLVWAWHRELLRGVWLKVVGLLVAAGAALGFAARLLSARVDDDGNMNFVIVGPVMLGVLALVIVAVKVSMRARSAPES
jgi:hypothetical protein